MAHRLPAALAAGALLALAPVSVALAASDDEPRTTDEAIAAAVRWMGRQQRPDGGFDGYLAGSGTPDVVLALAESAQAEAPWGNRPAVERVESEVAEDGETPLDAVRDIAGRVPDRGVPARLVTRVALPLGLDPDDEGPLGDLLGGAADGLADEDSALVDRVESAIALLAGGVELPEGTIDEVVGAQQADGGWNEAADPEGEVVDLTTTGAVVDLLVLAGVDPAAAPISTATAFVARTQRESGAWPGEDGHPDAAATAGAIRAIRAIGHDPGGSCWQGDLGVEVTATTPVAALIDLQEADGGFAGEEPVRVTAEAVHALSGRRLPVGRAGDQCTPESGGLPFDPSLIVLGAIAVVGVGGGVRIMRSTPVAL